jgi:tetratricopeptide (TPR) repeat protein
MRSAAAALLALTLVCGSCGPGRHAVPTPAPDIAGASARLRQGCYRCLEEALAIARPSAAQSEPARALAFDAGLLLAARDRELGMLAADHLPLARTLAKDSPRDRLLLAVVDAMPWPAPTQGPASRDDALMAWRRLEPVVPRWHAELSALPPADLPARYVLQGLTCTWPFMLPGAHEADAATAAGTGPGEVSDSPLLQFRRMLCDRPDPDAVASMLERQPRFEELHLAAGNAAMNGGALLTAERHYRAAFEAFGGMLPAAHGLARVHVMLEEYEASLPEYDAVLSAVTDQQDCLLGKARALTQLGRHGEAIALLDRLIAIGTWLVGDAHYWRGWNRLQVGELDGAAADAEAALKLMVNARVHVLAGAVAARRGDWPRARAEFETALPLDESDCDIPVSLGSVLGEQREWAAAYTSYARAALCLVGSQEQLSKRVAEIDAAPMSEERRARFLARTQAAAAAAHRLEGQSRYNAAVSLANQGRTEDARTWATQAAEWPEWRERAGALLRARKP